MKKDKENAELLKRIEILEKKVNLFVPTGMFVTENPPIFMSFEHTPKPPEDRIYIIPGIFGMRFTKWLIKRRKQKLQRELDWLKLYENIPMTFPHYL